MTGLFGGKGLVLAEPLPLSQHQPGLHTGTLAVIPNEAFGRSEESKRRLLTED